MGQAGIDLEYQSQGFVSTDVTQNAGGSIIRFRTKYVPLQCLHDLDFILMGGTNTPKMYIKLYCKFKRNDDPNADFVTAVYTFDAGNKLATATSVGSQNSGSMYFYDAAPTSNNADIHSVISHLYVYGAYGSPNYGNQPGNGTYNFGVPMASTGSITIPSNSMVYQYTPSYPNSINFLLSSMMDINAQDAVVVNGGNGEPDKLVQLTAYNDINFGDGPLINQASKLYAGNTINILHGGTIDATAYLPAVTDGIEFYAGNAINLGQGPPGFSSSLTIKGNVTFSASKSLPVYAVLHGCDDPDPISTYQESNSVISALCTAVGERVMAPSISEVSNSNNETIISFFPNPASNLLFFNIRTPYEGNVTVHITDVNGRIIREYQYTYVIGNNDFNLDLTGIGSGIYLVTASDSFDSVLKRDKICVIQ